MVIWANKKDSASSQTHAFHQAIIRATCMQNKGEAYEHV